MDISLSVFKNLAKVIGMNLVSILIYMVFMVFVLQVPENISEFNWLHWFEFLVLVVLVIVTIHGFVKDHIRRQRELDAQSKERIANKEFAIEEEKELPDTLGGMIDGSAITSTAKEGIGLVKTIIEPTRAEKKEIKAEKKAAEAKAKKDEKIIKELADVKARLDAINKKKEELN